MLLRVIIFYCLLCKTLCSTSEPKIVGGVEVVDRSKFAYQAYLLHGGYFAYCGASIISAKHALTAAHCCFLYNETLQVEPSAVAVVTGNLDLYDRTNLKQVEDVFVHEDYDYETLNNDIAIFKILDTFEPWTDNIQPIVLNRDYVNSGDCIVSGWGTTYSGGNSMNNKLMYVEVPIVHLDVCYSAYLPEDIFIDENKICAGVPGKDSCQGDSGGPMVCSDKLTGIVSFGIECGHEIFPGVYTDVARYIDWIEHHMLSTTTPSTASSTDSSTASSTSSQQSVTPDNITATTPSSSTSNAAVSLIIYLFLWKIVVNLE
jgi:trypsin